MLNLHGDRGTFTVNKSDVISWFIENPEEHFSNAKLMTWEALYSRFVNCYLLGIPDYDKQQLEEWAQSDSVGMPSLYFFGTNWRADILC